MPENNKIEKLIVHYLQQEITEEEMVTLYEWLEQDPDHKETFFRFKKIYESRQPVRTVTPEEIKTSWNKMYRKIRMSDSRADQTQRQRFSIPELMKYAVVLVIGISIGWSAWFFAGNESQPVNYNEIHIAEKGKMSCVTLPDGSRVYLNAKTSFKYPERFTGHSRDVYLDGEAYFDIAPDESFPFVVKLDKQEVTVLGTTFNIEAYSHDPSSIITLLSGKVQIDNWVENSEETAAIYLKPDQRLVTDKLTGKTEIQPVEASLSNAWIDGLYKVKDETLSTIMKRLQNYYGIKIRIADPHLEQEKYTGTLALEGDINEILNIINYEKQFSFAIIDGEIVIHKK